MKTINFFLSDTGAIIGGSPDGVRWLAEREARLAAENAELRRWASEEAAKAMRAQGERADAEAERDRLRALVARMLPRVRETLSDGTIGGAAYDRWMEEGHALLADPDGQSAAEWLEAEKAKAAEPWKALAVRLAIDLESAVAPLSSYLNTIYQGRPQPNLEQRIKELLDVYQASLADAHAQAALAWLADREAKAREEGRAEATREAEALLVLAGKAIPEAVAEGRRQGLAEAAEYCRGRAEQGPGLLLDRLECRLLEVVAEEDSGAGKERAVIVVKLELWPGGDESRTQDLGKAEIFNVTDLAEISSYGVRLLKGARYSKRPGTLYKEGRVDNFPRRDQRWGPWELLALALESTVGYRIAGLKRFIAQARVK